MEIPSVAGAVKRKGYQPHSDRDGHPKGKQILLADGERTRILPNEGFEHFTPHQLGIGAQSLPLTGKDCTVNAINPGFSLLYLDIL